MQEIHYGTPGRLDYDPVSETLLCHMCGRGLCNLAQHVRLSHGLQADEYRALVGLNHQTRLITPALSARLREVTAPRHARLRAEGKLTRFDEDPEKWRRATAAAVEVLHEGLRLEGRERKRASFDEERRRRLSTRTRERRLRGEFCATPEALSAGVKRHLAAHPEAVAAMIDRLKPYPGPPPAVSRDVPCLRCTQLFRTTSPRAFYCSACRPVQAREATQRWRQKHKADAERRATVRREAASPVAPT